jgi:hypothetical protein
MIVHLELIVGEIKAWRALLFALEARAARSALKKRRKCLAKTRGTADLKRSL